MRKSRCAHSCSNCGFYLKRQGLYFALAVEDLKQLVSMAAKNAASDMTRISILLFLDWRLPYGGSFDGEKRDFFHAMTIVAIRRHRLKVLSENSGVFCRHRLLHFGQNFGQKMFG